jgi:hypothetical protein
MFLDDERFPAFDGAVICRSFDDAKACVLSRGVPCHVHFDHDIGDGPTGHDFAKWLVEFALDGNGFPRGFDVHSQNPIGARNIVETMNGYIKYAKEA